MNSSPAAVEKHNLVSHRYVANPHSVPPTVFLVLFCYVQNFYVLATYRVQVSFPASWDLGEAGHLTCHYQDPGSAL